MSSSSTNLWVLLGLGIAGIILVSRKLKKNLDVISRQDLGAFVRRLQLLPPPQPLPPKAPHPLTSLSFAVSDVFNIEGFVTGFGSPDWERTHEAAARTASAVRAVVEGGATCVGKTVVDEFAFSISGENKHYGTPTNPAAHARVPGGPCSGSAAAVAGGFVDFALGIDTIGGVRIPGGFCGVLGFRPSYGAVSTAGVIPVSPSFDTVGWFARDPSILSRVGHVLLQLPYVDTRSPRHVIIADDCFQLLKIPNNQVSQVVIRSAEKVFGRQVLNHANLGDYLDSKVPSLKQFKSINKNGDSKMSSLQSLAIAARLLQRHEFKSSHGEWINSAKLVLDPVMLAHMQAAQETGDADIDCCRLARDEMRAALNSLLEDDGILVIPTVSDIPPKLGSKELISEDYQIRALSLLVIASMSGCCQVTVPVGSHDKCPLSVSFIARHGGGRFLLDSLKAMYTALQEQADIAAKANVSSNSVNQKEAAEIAKEKGNIAYKQKQWQKAINFYTEAIKLNGKNATYYSNRAAAYLEQGSFLQAEDDCSKALGLDKKNVKAYLRRGSAREMLGYYKESIEDFTYALVLEPTNKQATLAVNRLKKLF